MRKTNRLLLLCNKLQKIKIQAYRLAPYHYAENWTYSTPIASKNYHIFFTDPKEVYALLETSTLENVILVEGKVYPKQH